MFPAWSSHCLVGRPSVEEQAPGAGWGEGSSLLVAEARNFCISLLTGPGLGCRAICRGPFQLKGGLCGAQASEDASHPALCVHR